jgi:hypothetical protein
VLDRLAQSPHLPMLVFPLQDGTSYLLLEAPHPPIPGGCVLVEIRPSWAIGPLFLALLRQGCKMDTSLFVILFVLGLDGQLTHLRTIRNRIIGLTYYATFRCEVLFYRIPSSLPQEHYN